MELKARSARRKAAVALRARIVLACAEGEQNKRIAAAHAILLCADEKSHIRALDRSQPMPPMRPGQVARRTHDCKRHGTTSLFAALDIATGRVIGKCCPRHRATQFRRFLDEIEARNLDVHMVVDNYATHKAPLVRGWLARRPRWHVHLTPTSSAWLNQVERFCSYDIPAAASWGVMVLG